MTNRSNDKAAVKLSSPACSMHEADDAYMGYAGKDELPPFSMNCSRRSAPALGHARERGRAASGPIAELMRRIQRDEARGAPCWPVTSGRSASAVAEIGAFYGKAMAIEDLGDAHHLPQSRPRLGWCESCAKYCPRAQRSALHADLAAMLQSHEVNIALAADSYGPRSLNGVGTAGLD